MMFCAQYLNAGISSLRRLSKSWRSLGLRARNLTNRSVNAGFTVPSFLEGYRLRGCAILSETITCQREAAGQNFEQLGGRVLLLRREDHRLSVRGGPVEF